MDYQKLLLELKPQHEFFIGIDSDGCVFDTMEVKQKNFFIPNALKFFDLQPISKELREAWEFVNLYSVHRGGNRFTSLIKVFELLKERQSIKDRIHILPDLSFLVNWVNSETRLSNSNLLKYFQLNYHPDLAKVVAWTEAVNKDITEKMGSIPPFPAARKAVEILSPHSDMMIVSQTPLEALEREWKEHNLEKFVMAIAGQEHGTKTEHITLGTAGRYTVNKILMIGDARGDQDAAFNNGVLFYPVIPGRENESWERFINEGFEKFINGTYAGEYENRLLSEFADSLPVQPPWSK